MPNDHDAALARYGAVGALAPHNGIETKTSCSAREECRRASHRRTRAQLVARRNAGASLERGPPVPASKVGARATAGRRRSPPRSGATATVTFCFNHNQPDYERFFREGCPWEEGVARAAAENDALACVGLTGGEPLLDLENALLFLERAGELWPGAHKRLYTSGDLLTAEAAARLRDAGLDEIRFSVKDDDAPEQQERVIAAMRLAKGFIPSVMVEMPVIPGARTHLQQLFRQFEDVGIDGINLLEFCFPFCNWDEFARRGLTLKNPPFEVMYDYGYSGGLAVAGSEELALELMLWALDEGLSFGMHYCSIENKHRSEMRQKNERAAHAHPCVAFDEGDFFLKTAKAFGPDVEPVRAALEAEGCADFMEDPEEGSLAFPPRFLETARSVRRPDGEPVQLQRCFLVYEVGEDGGYLIDVALRSA